MKWRKFLIFIISVLGISIVILNNLAGLSERIFTPFSIRTFLSFALIIIGVIAYMIINKDMMK